MIYRNQVLRAGIGCPIALEEYIVSLVAVANSSNGYGTVYLQIGVLSIAYIPIGHGPLQFLTGVFIVFGFNGESQTSCFLNDKSFIVTVAQVANQHGIIDIVG